MTVQQAAQRQQHASAGKFGRAVQPVVRAIVLAGAFVERDDGASGLQTLIGRNVVHAAQVAHVAARDGVAVARDFLRACRLGQAIVGDAGQFAGHVVIGHVRHVNFQQA